MFPFFFDSTMVLLIPALIITLYAQAKVRSNFRRYSQQRARCGLTGAQLAARLMRENQVDEVEIEPVAGTLTDHYDPRDKTLHLSEEVYSQRSIAALGVAAHETGHAFQHAYGYFPLMLRTNFVPVANLGTTLAWPLFFMGFLFSWPPLMDIGIILFSCAVIFSLLTLPVEFNASSRAINLLRIGRYLSAEEIEDARKMLNAAAWTYIAAASMAVLQLLRLLILRGAQDD